AAQKADFSGDSTAATINHSLTLLQRLQELLQNGNGSDSVLRVRSASSDEPKVFHTHQLLLSLQSEVFESLLRNQSVVTLYEPPETAALFEKFIRCVGTPRDGEVRRVQLSWEPRGTPGDGGREMFPWEPQGSRGRYISGGMQPKREDSPQCPLRFCGMGVPGGMQPGKEDAPLGTSWDAARSDLVLHSELELYTAVEGWLSRRQPEAPVAERVLRAIRYPMIAPSQLFRLQAQSAVLARHRGAVQDLLFQAFQFHAASPLHFAKYFDVNCSMFLPRNYLAPSWGSHWGSQWVITNPARDDRSTSFQTQLGPSSHDAGKRVTWNVLFSPRWLPVSLRPVYSDSVAGAIQPVRIEDGRPRLVITPAMSSPDFAGVSFQKTVLVGVRQQGRVLVKHAYSFHQSSDEAADFLAHADLQKRTSEYLIDNSLHLHIIIKPVYHSLIKVKK
ncbi:BTBDH protein, partial [Illadopsis cleaveri]|nr:BTBDH protein [Illadopsis cleaveri]